MRTGNPVYLRVTKFFGKLFLINFAIGVVTGIVQEFQFGMNWSSYSRFVGDVFGAPLAMEALLAFFLESTFIGLWIFGWDKLPPGCTPPACGWCTIGTHAVGVLHPRRQLVHAAPGRYRVQPGDRSRRADRLLGGVFNKVAAVTFSHVIFAAFLTARRCSASASPAWFY